MDPITKVARVTSPPTPCNPQYPLTIRTTKDKWIEISPLLIPVPTGMSRGNTVWTRFVTFIRTCDAYMAALVLIIKLTKLGLSVSLFVIAVNLASEEYMFDIDLAGEMGDLLVIIEVVGELGNVKRKAWDDILRSKEKLRHI